jgi:hypothetical protein
LDKTFPCTLVLDRIAVRGRTVPLCKSNQRRDVTFQIKRTDDLNGTNLEIIGQTSLIVNMMPILDPMTCLVPCHMTVHLSAASGNIFDAALTDPAVTNCSFLYDRLSKQRHCLSKDSISKESDEAPRGHI